MEQRKPINHILAGLIISAAMVIFSLVMNFIGQGQNQALGWLAYLIFVVALIYFINQYSNANNNRLSFGGLFSYGFKITSIVTLVVILFMVIFFWSFPEYKDKIMEASRQSFEKQDSMTDDQVDQAIEMMDRNFILFAAGGALFMYLLLGVIGSLIGAAVAKKNPNNPLDQLSV